MGRERVCRDVLNWIEVGKSGKRRAEVGFGQEWADRQRWAEVVGVCKGWQAFPEVGRGSYWWARLGRVFRCWQMCVEVYRGLQGVRARVFKLASCGQRWAVLGWNAQGGQRRVVVSKDGLR
jgi:hypothetical protein